LTFIPLSHTDHLNTPRLVANAAGTTVWRWDQQEPFGDSVPDENPSGLGAFEFPLGFPGQYRDKETGNWQNWNRDYAAYLGQYVESDPIGLRGGLNSYIYSYQNALSWSDPLGLAPHPKHKEKCESLRKTIENTAKDIEKRTTDIMFNNELPLLPPYPGAPNSMSVSGHQKIIDDMRNNLQRRNKEYKEKCCDDCDNGSGSQATSTDSSTATTLVVGGAGLACVVVTACILQPQLCPLFVLGAGAAGAAAR
jgi:RHS repeat-associated protein